MNKKTIFAAAMLLPVLIVVALIASAVWQGLDPAERTAVRYVPPDLPDGVSDEAKAAWKRMRPFARDVALPLMRCRTEGGQRICQPVAE